MTGFVEPISESVPLPGLKFIGDLVKAKSVAMIITLKKSGIFIVTLCYYGYISLIIEEYIS